jgi:transposase-like protein
MDPSKSESGRRRWTSKQRQQLVAQYRQSQLTQRQFATRHGIGLSTLSKWLRRKGNLIVPPVKFQEVTLPQVAPRWGVEVVSPTGWVVRLPQDSGMQTLPQLLRALPC